MNIQYSEFLRYRHTDSALRYLPIVEDINRNRKNVRILEVGSGGLGIYPYLGKKIYASDINFDLPRCDQVVMVYSNAQLLPFKEKTFDIVLAVDVLEHIPSMYRKAVIRELIRVAKEKAYIAFPTGKPAEEHDRKYHRYYLKKHGASFPFFEDHLNYGLPEDTLVETNIIESALALERKVIVSRLKNVNIHVRNFLMFLWINHYDRFYRYTMFLCKIRKWLNWGKCYRSILVVQFDEK